VAHLTLNAFCVCTGLDQPSRVGRSQATPVDEGQPKRFGRRFDVPSQNVLVIYRLTVLDALKNQIVWPRRFNQLVFSHCTPRTNFYGERCQAGDAGDYLRSDANRRRRGAGFGG